MHKRFEMRRTLKAPLEIICSDWDEPVEMSAADLSPRGAFVESEIMPELGEHLVCSFKLGSGGYYCFFGEVTRVNWSRRNWDRGRPGFGIEFLDASPLERLAIRRGLRGLPPPFPVFRDGPPARPLPLMSRKTPLV